MRLVFLWKNFLWMSSDLLLQSLTQFSVFTDPPETSIYPKNDVELGVQNTLICHVTGFFPPPVNVSWTKNNVIVTEGVSLSQNRPRSDGNFHMFSSLKIIPEERDIYSCTVNHRALQGPQTKIWGKKIKWNYYNLCCFLYEWCMYKTTYSAVQMKYQEQNGFYYETFCCECICSTAVLTSTHCAMIDRCRRGACCATQCGSSAVLWSGNDSGPAGSGYWNLLLY